MTRTRTPLVVAAVFSAALVLAACSDGPQSVVDSGQGEARPRTPNPGNLATLEVAVVPTSETAAIYIAEQQGYFSEAGLEVNTTFVQSGADAITGLINGGYDVGFLAAVPFVTAAAKDLPLAVLAGASTIKPPSKTLSESNSGLVVLANSEIQTLTDLEGKAVGVNALRGAYDLCLRSAIEQEGGEPKEVGLLEVPFQQVPLSLDRGDIDAAVLTGQYLISAVEAGYRNVSDVCGAGLGEGAPFAFYVTTTDTAADDDKTESLLSFRDALRVAYEYAESNPQRMRDAIAEYTGTDLAILDDLPLPSLSVEVDPESLNDLATKMEHFGFIEERVEMQVIE